MTVDVTTAITRAQSQRACQTGKHLVVPVRTPHEERMLSLGYHVTRPRYPYS
jgi:hypothetical protein